MKGFLFFDIDGTIVDSHHGERFPDESVMHAIRKAQENGWKAFLCSGRNYSGAKHILDLGFDGAILSDGAHLIIEDHEIRHPIPQDQLKKVRKQLSDIGGSILMSASELLYLDDKQMKMWGMEPGLLEQGIRHISDYDGRDVYECDIAFDGDVMMNTWLDMKDPALEFVCTTASYGRDGGSCGEITNAGVTKGSGIEEIVAYYGGDMKDTYAFGDSMNDAPAIVTAHVGICMGNGAEELKGIADYVTDPINEDGIVNAFRKFGIE